VIHAYSRHILDTFIHFMKAMGERHSSFDEMLVATTRDSKSWCPFTHGKSIDVPCYLTNPAVADLLALLEKYILCSRFLDSNRYYVDAMRSTLSKLRNPDAIGSHKRFAELLSEFRTTIHLVDPDIRKKIAKLTCDECERLDEALVSYSNYCFRASTIMAVSAVEFRLHYMIKNTNRELYRAEFEKATLGKLIQVFDKNMYEENRYKRIKQLMPDRHLPLVELLNQYRIFSAHPKELEVTPQIAESILGLSFAFLIDPATCQYPKSHLKHERRETHTASIDRRKPSQKEKNKKEKKP